MTREMGRMVGVVVNPGIRVTSRRSTPERDGDDDDDFGGAVNGLDDFAPIDQNDALWGTPEDAGYIKLTQN